MTSHSVESAPGWLFSSCSSSMCAVDPPENKHSRSAAAKSLRRGALTGIAMPVKLSCRERSDLGFCRCVHSVQHPRRTGMQESGRPGRHEHDLGPLDRQGLVADFEMSVRDSHAMSVQGGSDRPDPQDHDFDFGCSERRRVAELFAPFVRDSPPMTTLEAARTALAALTLLPIRLLLLALLLAVIYGVSAVSLALFPHEDTPLLPGEKQGFHSRGHARKMTTVLICVLIRVCLFAVFGVFSIDVQCLEQGSDLSSATIVANHLGCGPNRARRHAAQHTSRGVHSRRASGKCRYLDVLVILATFRSTFVAAGWVKSAPIVVRNARPLFLFPRPASLVSPLPDSSVRGAARSSGQIPASASL